MRWTPATSAKAGEHVAAAYRLGTDVVHAARRMQRGEHRRTEVVGVHQVRPGLGTADSDRAPLAHGVELELGEPVVADDGAEPEYDADPGTLA